MSNTFVTPSAVVRDATLILMDELLVGNLIRRNTESIFASKVGSTVKVKTPPSFGSASSFTSTTSATNLVETSVDVTLEEHFYVRVDLTSDDLTQKVDDFTTLVVMPAIRALVRSVETYLISKMVGGFAPNVSGTAGNSPSTHAHILAAEKLIFDNRGDTTNLLGLLTSTAHAAFAQLNIFTSSDYGPDRPIGLSTNSLGKIAGINYFRSPNATTFNRGAIATSGAVEVVGASNTGTSLSVDGFTAATGTIYEGTRFTIEGIAGTTFTVTKNATLAGNATTLTITPALPSSPADNADLTFEAAVKPNVIFNPAAVSGAIIPGAIIGPNVSAFSANGLGVRIINNVSTDTLSGTWVFDLYTGAKVTRPEYGALLQG